MRAARATGVVVAASAALLLARGPARAQSFVQRVDDDDACREAATYESEDQSAAAMHARRACRLARFERRLANERQARVAAAEDRRVAAAQAWMGQEPTRVVRPIAVSVFVGSGLATYGIAGSWAALRRLTVDGWVGGHEITMSDFVSSAGTASYTSKTLGAGARWFLTDRDFSPYLGAEFATTSADLTVSVYDPSNNTINGLTGSARGHAVAARAGLELSWEGLRASLEYVYAYPFYTQANKDDPTKTPDDQIRRVWQDSLDSERSGIRLQVGYAF